MKKDTGARALRAIIEEFMLDIMYGVACGNERRKMGNFQEWHLLQQSVL